MSEWIWNINRYSEVKIKWAGISHWQYLSWSGFLKKVCWNSHCAPLLTDLLLYFREAEFMFMKQNLFKKLLHQKKEPLTIAFTLTFEYIDGVLQESFALLYPFYTPLRIRNKRHHRVQMISCIRVCHYFVGMIWLLSCSTYNTLISDTSTKTSPDHVDRCQNCILVSVISNYICHVQSQIQNCIKLGPMTAYVGHSLTLEIYIYIYICVCVFVGYFIIFVKPS